MFNLRYDTPNEWVDTVLQDLDAFLVDHAACERKASANAISLIVRYPDKPILVTTMAKVAHEEMEHFNQLTEVVYKRGLQFTKDVKDPYINQLLTHCRNTHPERLVDRLLLFSIVEGRGCERFHLLSNALPEGSLKMLYQDLVRSESRHHMVGITLVKELFPNSNWESRYDEFLQVEAEIVRNLPLRSALH